MARITIKHRLGRSFDIAIRGYSLVSDEPTTHGGEGEGPTPTELMVAGLASCAADEAERRLAEMGMTYAQLEVGVDFDWDDATERIACVRLQVALPPGLSSEAGMLIRNAMLSCPALKMLTLPPEVECDFGTGVVVSLTHPDARAGFWPDEPPPDVDAEGMKQRTPPGSETLPD
jgi:putative redox protein